MTDSHRLSYYHVLGGCPRIGILFKIEVFQKIKRSHIHDIASIIFLKTTKSSGKMHSRTSSWVHLQVVYIFPFYEFFNIYSGSFSLLQMKFNGISVDVWCNQDVMVYRGRRKNILITYETQLPFSSFPRRGESSDPARNWIPACAGMTNLLDLIYLLLSTY